MKLAWKKDKTGIVFARGKKHTWTVHVLPPAGVRVYNIFRLSRDGTRIYDAAQGTDLSYDKTKKETCKRVAQALEDGRKPVADEVYKTVPKDRRAAFDFFVKDVFYLRHVPRTDGPMRKLFEAGAKEGRSPRLVANENGLEVGEDYLDSLSVELWTTIDKARAKADAANKKVSAPSVTPPPPKPGFKTVVKPPPDPEDYKGPEPRPRHPGLRMEVVPTQRRPCPFLPETAKFSELYSWGERIRDHWQQYQRLATVTYLCHAIDKCSWPSDRKKKAEARLKLIYKEDYAREKAVLKTYLDAVGRNDDKDEVKASRKKVERDRFGNKIGTRAAAINKVLSTVPKSPKRIRKEAELTGSIVGHLTHLKDKGLVDINERGRWFVKDGKPPGKAAEVKKSGKNSRRLSKRPR
jgi:hypothetical protein